MLETRVIDSVSEVAAVEWDALVAADDPFTEHAFLAALEASGSVGPSDTGWLVRHVLIYDGTLLVGAAPLYEKTHSYGEYVFDFGWAHAAARAGIAYYPKLVSAVPFTPATGARLLVHPACERTSIEAALARAFDVVQEACGAHSTHVLFLPRAHAENLRPHGFMPRVSYQYHFENAAGMASFDDYLAAMRSASRKQVRRERARAASHGLTLSMRSGNELTDADWAALYDFYLDTVDRKGGMPYLRSSFFEKLRSTFSHRVVAAFAHRGSAPVAASLFFFKGHSLYGRYWGARDVYESLHFELCYYLPMEWGLPKGLKRFEAGAQGDHKLKRGFLPRLCWSAHRLQNPLLAEAVSHFIASERGAVLGEVAELAQHSPFRSE